jgi:hypothetical protein
VQRQLAARFDGEVAGGAVADSSLVFHRALPDLQRMKLSNVSAAEFGDRYR